MDMELIGALIVSALLVILGIFNCRGNVDLIHWYHRTRVRPEDRLSYGRTMGAGTILIGLTVAAAAVLERLTEWKTVSYVVLALGLAAGLGVIVYGQFKYNKGIF